MIGAHGLFLLALALLAALACWFDIRERRLPNWLSGTALVLGIALAVSGAPGGALGAALGGRLAHFAIALVCGMGLYRAGMIGAGDAKFYAALAAWFPLGAGLRLLMSVSLVGLVLSLGWIVWRRRRAVPVRAGALSSPRGADHDKLPFGVAIALGALCALAI